MADALIQKLHQAQLLDNPIVGWNMLSKEMSSNPAEMTYDYNTIKCFGNMGLIDDAYPTKVLKTVYGLTYKAKWADLIKRTEAVQIRGKMENMSHLKNLQKSAQRADCQE